MDCTAPSTKSVDETSSRFYDKCLFEEYLECNMCVRRLPEDEQWKSFMRGGINPFTMFFREEISQVMFEKAVIPSYPKNKDLMVASVGCSTGKEPYSILLWNWKERERLCVHGYDIKPGAIEEAKKGIYDTWAEPEEELARILDNLDIPQRDCAYRLEGGETIAFLDQARERVSFFVHDILKKPLPQKYDVVFLMNVLYHFPKAGIERIISNCHDSMSDGGYLICESARGKPVQDKPKSKKSNEYHRFMEDLSGLGFEKQAGLFTGTLLEDMMKSARLYVKSCMEPAGK